MNLNDVKRIIESIPAQRLFIFSMSWRMEFHLNCVTKKNELPLRNCFTRKFECFSKSFSALNIITCLCSLLKIIPSRDLEEIITCIRLTSFIKMNSNGYSSREHILFKLNYFASFIRMVCFKYFFNCLIKTFWMICKYLLSETNFLS